MSILLKYMRHPKIIEMMSGNKKIFRNEKDVYAFTIVNIIYRRKSFFLGSNLSELDCDVFYNDKEKKIIFNKHYDTLLNTISNKLDIQLSPTMPRIHIGNENIYKNGILIDTIPCFHYYLEVGILCQPKEDFEILLNELE